MNESAIFDISGRIISVPFSTTAIFFSETLQICYLRHAEHDVENRTFLCDHQTFFEQQLQRGPEGTLVLCNGGNFVCLFVCTRGHTVSPGFWTL